MSRPAPEEAATPAADVLGAMSEELRSVAAMLRRYESAAQPRAGDEGRSGRSLADLQNLDLSIQIVADLEDLTARLSQFVEGEVDPARLAPGLRLERSRRLVGAADPEPARSGGMELFGPDASA